MNIKEKLMNLIGVAVMTNKDLILMELDAMDGKTFEEMVLSGRSDLSNMVEFARCEDCKALHDGNCPHPEDDACPTSTAEWLAASCKRERILREG